MYQLYKFLETEEKEHNAEWFNTCCRYVRLYMQPLISKNDAETGMNYILGKQNLEYIQNQYLNPSKINLTNNNYQNFRGTIFDKHGVAANKRERNADFLNPEMANMNFRALPIMEKLKNIILSDIKKMGVIVTARSEDPTSRASKEYDRHIIENRKKIERDLSYLYTSIGDKPYKMKDHQHRFGEKLGNGNIQIMDEMGMDSGDPADVDFIFQHFYKLDTEIAVEKMIDALHIYNRTAEYADMWGLDMIAKKCIAARNYVDKLTGELKSEYVTPETAFVFGGTTRNKDFGDCLAKAVEQTVTLREALQLAGDAFDIEKEFTRILAAIQVVNAIEFTGIDSGWQGFVDNGYKLQTKNNGVYGYKDIMSMNVTLGYMEISSQIQVDEREVKSDGTNTEADKNQKPKNSNKEGGAYYENNQPPDKKRYATKARYETPLYCAYYLALSQLDQIIFDFGKVPYQQIDGYNDQRNNFSIITYKETGDAIGQTCQLYVDLINECWYKYNYEIKRAKPPGTDYNYDTLLNISRSLISDPETKDYDKVTMVMQMLDASANGLYTFPINPITGQAIIMTSGQLHVPKPNGITENALLWFKIILEIEKELMATIGISDLRQADPGNTKDSVSNQFKALEYSLASTYYITDMITRLYQNISVRDMFFVQDIIHYKEYEPNTMAYDWLENLAGAETLDTIAALGKKALHRFGIFIESLNNAPLKAKLDAVLANDQNTAKITTGEALIINDIKSPKAAWKMLAYFEQRNKKLEQKAAQAAQEAAQKSQQAIEQLRFNTEKMKQDNLRLIAYMNNQTDIKGKGIQTESSLAKQAMKQESDYKAIYAQAHADILKDVAMAEQAIGKSGAVPPPPSPQQGPGGNTFAPPEQAGSQQQQLQQQANPMQFQGGQ